VLRFFSRLKPIYRSAFYLTLLIICINLLLLIYGYLTAGTEYVFGGLLYNTIDGQSYFVKMKEGFNGSWRFTLAYSCAKSDGAYVFLYYLFLGHLTRWLGLSIPFTYHLFRLLNAGILVFTLACLIKKIIPDDRWAKPALWLTCLGSSMGYVALMFGTLSDNERVAEGYPFLSIFGNPHFTLGMALFTAIIVILMDKDCWRNALKVGVLALLLAVVQPFMIVSILAVAGLHAAWKLWRERRLDFRMPLLILLGGGVYLTYQYWALTTDPVLALWTAQNLTPSPALWDFLLCISPAVFFFAISFFRRQQIAFPPHPIIPIWFFSLVVLTYLPFALQRRFMAGIYIPLVILAFVGITTFMNNPRMLNKLHRTLWVLSLPGAIIFLLLPIYGISTLNSAFFLTREEADAFRWLKENGKPHSLVLASPSTGLFIPTYSEDCVFYGHPFETLNQETNKQLVTNMFGGVFNSRDAQAYLSSQGVDYIFYGPREKKLGDPGVLLDLPEVYTNGDVTIYEYPQD
jgi:hypothetical protein